MFGLLKGEGGDEEVDLPDSGDKSMAKSLEGGDAGDTKAAAIASQGESKVAAQNVVTATKNDNLGADSMLGMEATDTDKQLGNSISNIGILDSGENLPLAPTNFGITAAAPEEEDVSSQFPPPEAKQSESSASQPPPPEAEQAQEAAPVAAEEASAGAEAPAAVATEAEAQAEAADTAISTEPNLGTVKEVLSCLMKSMQDKSKMTVSTRKRKRGPQPPSSAIDYFRFDTLHDVCKQNPTSSPEEIILIVENKWQLLKPTEKEVYEKKSKEDQERYDNEIKLYLPKSQGGSMKRPKAKKHPNAPKHPKSAYLYFVGDNRARIKKENPGLAFKEIAQILGREWRALSKEENEKFQARAQADKDRYRREKEQMKGSILPPVETESSKDSKRRKKHPLAPKHPLSAYLFFIATNRRRMSEKYPDKDFKEVARMLGQMWKNLDASDRRIFEILAYADKKRYLEEKERWTPPTQNQEQESRSANEIIENDPIFYDWMYDQDHAASNPNASQSSGGRMMAMNHGGGAINPNSPFMMNPPQWGQAGQMPTMQDQVSSMYHLQPQRPPLGVGDYGSSSSLYCPPPVRQANKHESSLEVMKWTCTDVARFMHCIGYPSVRNVVLNSGIDGKSFINLSQTDLRERLGVEEVGDMKKITKAIEHLLTG
mmetsp:Transcript_31383/g.55197  ORF Transcript_31383/g.55197 Transcript_31383/m.55197 type:complete len:657 (+) Transcript_31383:109-2079(+)|eukprot:CAMPEP_0197528634 /NCGR_PEP_ID=MMETSP1318-20131121/25852_1 /TAXON_ID=552666 /ORGANISM="Partenskyella glossopodia, Strain RCC365" /LENGTH=656 /DNA_ID=CAMNT_0043083817 /DNA_START=70 /DNA_END=2040 /DNA_ORIENTATION=+